MGNESTEIVKVPCVQCKTVHTIQVPSLGIVKRVMGESIQECFPDLDAGLREMFVSGICPACWDKMFPEE